MPIRLRLLIHYALLTLASLTGVWWLSQNLLLQRFDQLDAMQLAETAHKLHRQWHQEMLYYRAIGQNWAWWDDSYAFIQDGNPAFIRSNLDEQALDNLRLHFILFYDPQGRLLDQRWRMPEMASLQIFHTQPPASAQELKEQTLALLRERGLNLADPGSRNGRVETLSQVNLALLVSATPILPSSAQGEPRGMLVMGSYFTRELLSAQQNQVIARFHLSNDELHSSAQQQLEVSYNGLTSHALLGPRRLDEQHQYSELTLLDRQGQPGLTFHLERERPNYLQGQQTINLFFGATLLIILLSSALAFAVFEYWVLRRLARLNLEISGIDGSQYLPRLSDQGHDEIGQLSQELNGMLERLSRSESRDKLILQHIEDGYFELNRKGQVVDANPALARLLGLPVEMLLGRSYSELLGEADTLRARNLFKERLQAGSSHFSAPFRRHDGSGGHLDTHVSVLRDNRGRLLGYNGILRDVSAQLDYQNRLLDMAYRDPLTQLGNRKAFAKQLQHLLGDSVRRAQPLALLFLDLDRFKEVNDSLGHDCGDLLLQGIAERMRKVVRGPDQIYRLGGDEFTLLLPDTPANAAQRLAARLLQELAAPFQLNGHPVDYITCSIGIAVAPEHAEDSESLIRAADQAMYQAKKQRNSACLYNGPRLFEEGQSQ